MVKNKKGGKKGKKGARRHHNQTDKSNRIRLKEVDDEIYAKIVGMHGNGADILCEDGIVRFLIWRQKFRGRNKRDNHIKMNGVILAGKRKWEIVAPKKKQKADLIFVYSKDHIVELYKKKNIPRLIFPDDVHIPMEKSTDVISINLEENEKIEDSGNIMNDTSLKILIDDI